MAQVPHQIVPPEPFQPLVRDRKVIVLASADSEHFRAVQITGFSSSAVIRELVLAKVRTPNARLNFNKSSDVCP